MHVEDVLDGQLTDDVGQRVTAETMDVAKTVEHTGWFPRDL